MQYKLVTDCAIKAVLYLADESRGMVSTYDLSEHIGYSRTTVQNIMRVLKRNTKWIHSFAGTEGGYRFIGNASKITLYDVHKAMDDEMSVGEGITRNDIMLDAIYRKFSKDVKEYFSSITLKDLLERKTDEEISEYLEGAKYVGGFIGREIEISLIRQQMEEMKAEYDGKIETLQRERDHIKNKYEDMSNKVMNVMNSFGK